jgi:carboxylesterase
VNYGRIGREVKRKMKKFNQPKPVFAPHGERAVILFHAYSGSPNDVRMLCRFLEQKDYTVYTPMFTGHGTTNPEDILNQQTQQWETDAKEAINFLKQKGYQKIAVLGLSMGGIFAMNCLTQEDSALIGGGLFCSPLFETKNEVPQNFELYAEMILQYSEYSPEEQQEILARVPQQVREQLQAIEAIGQKTAASLDKIDVPVFLAQAGADQMIDPETVFRTASGLSHVPYTLQWYPLSGHVVTIGPERKKLEQDVWAFLEGLAWKG